jgi:PAS domain S-box-containing protein
VISLDRTKGRNGDEGGRELLTLDEPLMKSQDVAGGMLSEREREVLFLAGDGLTDKEIALRLGIGPKTVRTYWDRMRAKLGAASRTEVLAKALRAAYDELAASEQRIRMFVQHMPVMFNAFDEEGNVILINEEVQRATGYPPEELVNNPQLYELLVPDPEQRQRVLRYFAEHSGDYRDYETVIDCADGTQKTIAWSSRAKEYPIPDWASWSIGLDITERVRAQEALKQSEESLRKLLQDSEQGVWIIDTEQKTTFVNQKLANMLGCRVEDVMGQRPSFFQEGASGELLREMLMSSPTTGGRIAFTTKFKRPDGVQIFSQVAVNPLYTEDGTLTGHAAVLTDITARKRTEENVALLKQAYNTLLNAVSDRIMRFNRDLSCVYANFELDNAGKDESPIIEGRAWEDLTRMLSPADEWCNAIRHVLNTGQRTYLDSVKIGKDKNSVMVLFLPEVSQDNTVSHVLAIANAAPVTAPSAPAKLI